MAWVLYNTHAAYMTHIYVSDPLKVRQAGIADQVRALVQLFTKKAGSAPTHVKIHVDKEQHAYTASEPPAWLYLLVPPGTDYTMSRGTGVLEHLVQPGVGPGVPTHWEGDPIKLTYDT